MRAAVVAVLGVAAAACTAGGSPGSGGDDGAHDAAIDARTGPVWIDAAGGDGGMVDCRPRVTSYGNGYHNAGKDCQGGCHNHGFTMSGTVYTGAANNTAYAGATVTIRTANSQTIELVVQGDGNFWTTQPIAYPVLVRVSACPYGTPMVATVANGRCNAVGCHAQQGGAQIHLP